MKIIASGAFMAALSVILGAFGTHALRGRLGFDLLQIYETSTHYLQLHAIAVLAYGLWRSHLNKTDDSEVKIWPILCFWIGTGIFSGSLYLITFTGIRGFGMITPIGGVLLIAAWIGFGVQAFRHEE